MNVRQLQRIAVLLTAATLAGCGSVSSTARRAGAVALGGTAGAGAGYLLGDHRPGATALGAAGGAALTHLALGEDADVRQAGFDDGYVHGQSDAIKRQYFLRRALEEQPPAAATSGEPVTYLVPGPEVTVDGRKLEPHQVAVRVIE